MMARGSAALPSYTPSLYLPGSMGRYRQYPRTVVTRIPGAGYKVGKLVWGEQVLNLDGAAVAPFNYASVPLLGLGQILPAAMTASPLLVAGALILISNLAKSRGSVASNARRRSRR